MLYRTSGNSDDGGGGDGGGGATCIWQDCISHVGGRRGREGKEERGGEKREGHQSTLITVR